MKYLYTKYQHYNKFVSENGTDRLEPGLKIFTTSKDILLKDIFPQINEIFQNVIKTEYKKETNTEYSFLTNSNSKYRLDIIPKKEYNTIINHLSFSDFYATKDSYDKLLNKNEMLEILNRIKYILIDLVNKNYIINNFCIGGTNLKSKNNIYEYMLKIIVGEDGFTKKYTKYYDTEWGLYFKI